uniref:MARVEL domain-containing protein n=1 Tax=Panagrellus redivivus TaxID=6233 RepID=A0A7E4VEW9_PANRE
MRAMNGRLQIMRSPLMRNNFGQHEEHKRHRQRSDADQLPKSIQFDESSDNYRCLCSCFHIKTGGFIVAGVELFLILFFFLNALLIMLQQKNGYEYDKGEKSSDYVFVAFLITTIGCAIALLSALLMLIGLARNTASFLVPHLFVQGIAIVCFTGLVIVGIIAVVTELSVFYRLLNATPFNEFPGRSTVDLAIESKVRVYFILIMYAVALILEAWFIVITYNCNRYFTERKTYMTYCLAYSTPLKTLNSAR